MRPVKVNCKRVTLIVVGILLAVVVFIYSHHRKILLVGNHMHQWMKSKASEITWRNIHCKNMPRWNSTSKWPPATAVGRQLHIKDRESVFINGLGCGEWLDALHGVFPNLKLFGSDTHFGSVHHVKTIVNGTFEKIIHPYGLLELSSEFHNFDHALTYGALSAYPKEQQCDTITKMLPLIKPGGSMYIGSNYEDCDPGDKSLTDSMSMAQIKVLPECFWSKVCLNGRQDIAEVIYVTEENAYDIPKIEAPWQKCASAVFIYKSITISKEKNKKPLYPSLQYPGQTTSHRCTRSDFVVSEKSHHEIKEGIKKAVKDMKLKGLDMH